ncbi:uncharacterized protein PGTG_19979 [Puccinia graminis f. sp. tritici CRL 75-36-700-3]|uniref:Uncharacterized protein n=1 Tax=Puccinia graminis f. sp. tritici (strain CRL 75-36-700-3 / race SCCL) TaxID=418459 RepID=E3LC01_PUCGT|nr:uncharacterized protein PGTG_19979 [Puccinia graminis f. sp. tritici CRL 75-36-700-3]EFP94076.1 hypothetical protein PGTG_19979 [Puccinia graminis f. sp. tritici CRL 75-36-700-3]
MYLADRALVLDYLIKKIIPDRELFMRPWIVDYQVTSVVKQISNEKQKGKSGLPETFRPLNTKVSIHAIVMLERQRDLYLKNRDPRGVELLSCQAVGSWLKGWCFEGCLQVGSG